MALWRKVKYRTGYRNIEQEARLMLTNRTTHLEVSQGHPNIIPFRMLGIRSSCAIVTLSLRRAILSDIRLQKNVDLEIWVRGHSRSLKAVPFDRLHMVSYYCSIETLFLKCTVFEIFDFKNAVTLKTGLGVRQGHWKCCHSMECIWLPIDVL